MPQEDRGDKGDHPSEMLEENGLVGKHTIQIGGGILLHSPLIPFLNLLAAFTIQCIPSFKYLFSSAPHFLSFLLFCFFTMPFTTSFSASSTHTVSPFSILSTAVFQWSTLFSFFLSTAQNILFSFLHSVRLFLSTPFSILHFLSFSPQGHFLTFPISLVTLLLFLSLVSRLKEIPEMKPSPMSSVNSGIIFKHQSKQEGRLLALLVKESEIDR